MDPSSKEEYAKIRENLLRKTPALTGVFLLSILAKHFSASPTCHLLSDDSVPKKDTEVSEEVPHSAKIRK